MKNSTNDNDDLRSKTKLIIITKAEAQSNCVEFLMIMPCHRIIYTHVILIVLDNRYRIEQERVRMSSDVTTTAAAIEQAAMSFKAELMCVCMCVSNPRPTYCQWCVQYSIPVLLIEGSI